MDTLNLNTNNERNSFRDSYNLHMLEVDATNIKFIENPSEKLQVMAVKSDPKNIRFIDNPTPRTQLIAVTFNPEALIYIDNPHQDTIDQVEFMSLLSSRSIDLLRAI